MRLKLFRSLIILMVFSFIFGMSADILADNPDKPLKKKSKTKETKHKIPAIDELAAVNGSLSLGVR